LEYGVYKGCPDPATAADCLRAIPAEKLDNPPWYHSLGVAGITGPITGTRELPIDPMTAFAEGKTARVPLMIGTTRDEWTLFMAMQWLSDPHMPDYQKVFTDTFGAVSGSIEQQYPLGQYANSALAYSAAMTDGVFACRAGQMEAEQAPNSPVYGYEFNDRQAPAPESLETVPFPVGAAHSLEVRYLFDVEGAPKFRRSQEKLRDQMIDYWSSFVSNGVPSADDAPDWPRLMAADGPWMSLETPEPRTMTSFEDEHKCAFWATVDDRSH
jgi:para-nitrobenzyl esterase